MDELKASAKPFGISRQEVWDAWVKVRGNKGSSGVDGVSIEVFEKDLKNNLSKVWNRMSSGTYFPPDVKAVPIPKGGGGTRVLGVPTVADRVAQTVVAGHLAERVEQVFHPDSFGYRPGKSALDAVRTCRERCWRFDWVVEFDIRKFFDTVPWDKVVDAVEAHTDAGWVVLYVKRWLAAGLRLPDGSTTERVEGTPQGSAVSPVLANLFLHGVDAGQSGFPSVLEHAEPHPWCCGGEVDKCREPQSNSGFLLALKPCRSLASKPQRMGPAVRRRQSEPSAGGLTLPSASEPSAEARRWSCRWGIATPRTYCFCASQSVKRVSAMCASGPGRRLVSSISDPKYRA
ncbi:reverse transcriptase domain-containing protein [Streptomyces sp. NPDC051219]|uniref:reverse transcriptase domain-containing protein n=1 Tax=Streptomyces sp. NPDC051219 TaxID=3155283 RepID=UPI00341644FB